MPDERAVLIARRLLELTHAGKLRWQPGKEPATFGARLGTGTALVCSDDPEGRYPYRLRLLDPSGADVGRLETGEDAERWLGDREADPWERTLCELYAAARNSAVHADDAVAAMLDELERR